MMRRRRQGTLVGICLAAQLLVGTAGAAGLVLCAEKSGELALEGPLAQAGCCAKTTPSFASEAEECCSDTPLQWSGVVRHDVPDDVPAPATAVALEPPAAAAIGNRRAGVDRMRGGPPVVLVRRSIVLQR